MKEILAFAFLAAVTNVSGALAADPVHLSCSGKWWQLEEKVFGQPMDGLSFTVDLDRMTVSGSLGDFTIYEISDNEVRFQAPFEEDGKTTGMKTGMVDRISGRFDLTWSRNGGASFFIVYQMVCRPTKPLF